MLKDTLNIKTTYLFTVEAYRGNCVEVLVELEPIEGCGLAGRVQAEHHNMERGARRRQSVQQRAGLSHVGTHPVQASQASVKIINDNQNTYTGLIKKIK